jgi:hypothetical protein
MDFSQPMGVGGEINVLLRFLQREPMGKIKLAKRFHLSTTNTIDKWISRKALPRVRREAILEFMGRGAHELSGADRKRKNKKAVH